MSQINYKIIYLLFLIHLLRLILAPIALAHCPLCAAGAGAGITLSRLLGIDDSITGIWVGAFLGAISFWTQKSLGQRKKVFFHPFVGFFLYILVFVSTLWSFYKFNVVVKHGDIFGIHKLTFGIILGGGVFYLVDKLNKYLLKPDGKVFFPYQRMVVSLGSMVVLSIFVFILINYYI